jgi:amicyanin
MKKVIVFFTCIVLLLVVSGCSQPQPAQGQPTPSPAVTIARPTTTQPITAWTLQPQTPTPSVSDNTISIQKMAYSPPSMTVKKGATVRWVNNDAVVHTVTFTKASGINPSGPLSASQSFSVKFDEPGTYPYSCAIHPSMQGTVIVE